MSDATGTETSPSDAQNAYESLFGDPADNDAAAVVADERDANKETEQDSEGPDDAGDEDGQPDDLKVVVSIKGGRATIGVQRPSSDPHIESFDDQNPSELAHKVLEVLERARAKWEGEPRYPAHAKPAPPARRQSRRDQGPRQASTFEREAGEHQPQTLSLF